MKHRYSIWVIVEAVIILILLISVAALFLLLNRSKAASQFPIMPTYDPVFSTATPFPAIPQDPAVVAAIPSISPTRTSLPVLILNGTPVYPTVSYNNNNLVRVSSPTSTPVAVTVWTYTPTPFAAIPQGQTCKNILYPMAVGQQWLYQAKALDRTVDLNMSVLSINNSQGSVLINNPLTDISKQVQVQCDGDVIRSFPFMSVDVLFGNSLDSSMTTSYVSGVLAPNQAAFLNSNWALAWSSQYLVSGTTIINHNGNQLNVTFNNSPITLACQTLAAGDAAFETITVAAGTFRALKVVCSEHGQVTATVNGISVTGLAEGRSYQWFAPNVGLVKMQVDYAAFNIFDIPFSFLTENHLELKSYSPAP